MHSVTDDRDSRPAWFVPSVADLVFLAVLLAALRLGRTALLNDPGTPWHIRVGELVWQSGPPHEDQFSFTRAGEPWISQAWLCDAALAVIYERWSWSGLVTAAALVLAWTYRTLFRTVLASGANVAWAAGLTLLAAGCGAAHWLVRSHLLSLLLFLLTWNWCLQYHRNGRRGIWAIPLVVVLWCNVHGGFLAGLIVVGCSLVGEAITAARAAASRRRVLGCASVLVFACLATLVNPYGWKLHEHLRAILFSSHIRDLIDEWRSPDFQAADSRPLEAMLLLSLILLATGRRRLTLFSLLHLVVWLHFGLQAIRQVALAAIVAAPVLGELTPEFGASLRDQIGRLGSGRWLDSLARRANEWTAEERAARWPIWSTVISILLAAATVLRLSVPALGIGAARLSEVRWPIRAVEELNRHPGTGPVFNDLNWGGYLILQSDPPRLVFVDDRFELYGREFLVAYLDALQYGPAWHALAARHQFEFVLVRPGLPLERLLRESSDWETLHADDTAVLLHRRMVPRLAAADRDSRGGSAGFAD